jgi:hypothetical protein
MRSAASQCTRHQQPHQIPKTGLYLEMKMLDVTERRKKECTFRLWANAREAFGNLPLLLRRRLPCVRVSERASERTTCAAGLLCCNEEEEEDESRAERQTRLALRRRVELAQTRRVDDGAHKKTKGKAVGWRSF